MTPEEQLRFIEKQKAFQKEMLEIWQSGIKSIFNNTIPDSVEWSNLNDIQNILNQVTSFKKTAYDNIKECANNHTFYPDGGGNDLYTCNKSTERGCIELDFNNENESVEIVRPIKLYFEKIDDSFEWSYFRLETSNLPLSDTDLFDKERTIERLYEVDGRYYDEINDDIDFSKSRVVKRRLKGGAFVIFHKASFYNLATGQLDAYDGRHNNMTAEEFKNHIIQYKTAVTQKFYNQ